MTRRITKAAMMAVLICICSWVTIPFIVPFTMQTFAVFCALLLLGGRDGTLAIGIYIFMGVIGLPVFSGFSGGIAHILGPTGGYIIGFIFMGLCYMPFDPLLPNRPKYRVTCLIIGLFLCYLIGTLWFVFAYSNQGEEMTVLSAATVCVVPYIFPDLLKLCLAVLVRNKVHRFLLAS